jgi:ATPase subunit of ABC transporter with duplicated ATPase domains
LQIISHNIHNTSDLQSLGNNYDNVKDQTSAVAMGGGEEAFYEKKLSKEEKKALAAKKREEKRKAKAKGNDNDGDDGGEDVVQKALENALKKGEENDGVETNEAAEQLASEGTICTFSTSRKGVDARSRDVNVQNFTLQHKGNVMLDGTSIVLNHGNRYGLIGRNGESLVFYVVCGVLAWFGMMYLCSMRYVHV